MPVRCQKCGIQADTGNFCPQCGGPFQQVPPPQAPQMPAPPISASSQPPSQPPYPPQAPQGYPPQAPQGYPPQAPQGYPPQAPQGYPPGMPVQPQPYPSGPVPPRKSGGSWVKWLFGGIGVIGLLLVGLIVLASLLPDDPAASDGATVSLVAQGTLAGGRGDFYGAYDEYLAEGMGNEAVLYQFSPDGGVLEMNSVGDADAGQLLDVSLGDMLNAGRPVMVATYERKIYVVPPTGEAQVVENNGTQRVLMGDYDGDTKVETIFLGERSFTVYRYEQGGDTRPLYRKENAANPFPVLFATRQKAGDRELLVGYSWEGDALSLILYRWDGVNGPTAIGQYPVDDSANAEWVASGPSAVGPTLVLSRVGTPATLEFFTISSDAKAASSLGKIAADGTGTPAVLVGPFMGGNPQLLAIDEAGAYFLYDVVGE